MHGLTALMLVKLLDILYLHYIEDRTLETFDKNCHKQLMYRFEAHGISAYIRKFPNKLQIEIYARG